MEIDIGKIDLDELAPEGYYYSVSNFIYSRVEKGEEVL